MKKLYIAVCYAGTGKSAVINPELPVGRRNHHSNLNKEKNGAILITDKAAVYDKYVPNQVLI